MDEQPVKSKKSHYILTFVIGISVIGVIILILGIATNWFRGSSPAGPDGPAGGSPGGGYDCNYMTTSFKPHGAWICTPETGGPYTAGCSESGKPSSVTQGCAHTHPVAPGPSPTPGPTPSACKIKLPKNFDLVGTTGCKDPLNLNSKCAVTCNSPFKGPDTYTCSPEGVLSPSEITCTSQALCWEANKQQQTKCTGYKKAGYKCGKDSCAALNPKPALPVCAVLKGAGYAVDPKSGTCVLAPTPTCWEASADVQKKFKCTEYEKAGYKCGKDSCASMNPKGEPNTCAVFKGAGYTVDSKSGTCVPTTSTDTAGVY